MGHYAKVDKGIVTQVIVASTDFFDSFVDTTPGEWIKCSYNTRGGVHYQEDRETPSDDQGKALRKNFPSPGFRYDSTLDAFIPPKPYESWILDEETCFWEPPVPFPEEAKTDGSQLQWDEETLSWIPE